MSIRIAPHQTLQRHAAHPRICGRVIPFTTAASSLSVIPQNAAGASFSRPSPNAISSSQASGRLAEGFSPPSPPRRHFAFLGAKRRADQFRRDPGKARRAALHPHRRNFLVANLFARAAQPAPDDANDVARRKPAALEARGKRHQIIRAECRFELGQRAERQAERPLAPVELAEFRRDAGSPSPLCVQGPTRHHRRIGAYGSRQPLTHGACQAAAKESAPADSSAMS